MEMNSIIRAHFERVETALNTLLESIASYNPSIPAANALIEADDDLNKGLEQLARHQQNYARILHLKQTTASLDARIKSTLELLAEARKELLAIPATKFPQSAEVPYGELLAYAKLISKFTVPPTYRAPPPPAKTDQDGKEQQNGDLNGASAKQNGSLPLPLESEVAGNGSKGIGIASLPNNEVLWLDPLSQMPWYPWPTEETIRRGALAQIQFMLENNIDPATQLRREEKEAAAEKERLEQEKLDEEERARKEKEVEAAERRHRAGASSAAVHKQQPVFAGIDLYDEEDE